MVLGGCQYMDAPDTVNICSVLNIVKVKITHWAPAPTIRKSSIHSHGWIVHCAHCWAHWKAPMAWNPLKYWNSCWCQNNCLAETSALLSEEKKHVTQQLLGSANKPVTKVHNGIPKYGGCKCTNFPLRFCYWQWYLRKRHIPICEVLHVSYSLVQAVHAILTNSWSCNQWHLNYMFESFQSLQILMVAPEMKIVIRGVAHIWSTDLKTCNNRRIWTSKLQHNAVHYYVVGTESE